MFLLDTFTWSEFTMSLQNRKNKTPDEFPYILIENLHESTKYLFYKLYLIGIESLDFRWILSHE